MISYEFPLNERIRTLLRMEALYERVRFFTSKDQPLEVGSPGTELEFAL